MGKKGTPHRKWSKEEKLRFIRLHLARVKCCSQKGLL